MIKWFKTNKALRKEIDRLNAYCGSMREHIQAQNKDIVSQKKKIRELERLLDIEKHTKRY